MTQLSLLQLDLQKLTGLCFQLKRWRHHASVTRFPGTAEAHRCQVSAYLSLITYPHVSYECHLQATQQWRWLSWPTRHGGTLIALPRAAQQVQEVFIHLLGWQILGEDQTAQPQRSTRASNGPLQPPHSRWVVAWRRCPLSLSIYIYG